MAETETQDSRVSRKKPSSAPVGYFATTHWTAVVSAGREDTHAAVALEELCRVYWYPLYAYIRRKGHSAHDAEDLTQSFFARFLEKRYLDDVDPAKGKFRSFLLSSLNHFLANEWDKANRLKRGGGVAHLSLDGQEAETRYGRVDAVDTLTPEKVFDREWALTLLDQVLVRLRAEYSAEGKAELFDAMKIFLTAGKGAIPYAEVAQRLGVSEGAVKVTVHRLRKRYRELLRSEIGQTVAGPEQVEEEIRSLFAAFGG